MVIYYFIIQVGPAKGPAGTNGFGSGLEPRPLWVRRPVA